ncbi:MAG: hypothetical protein V4722_03200 [Bacteroidota bacterium]
MTQPLINSLPIENSAKNRETIRFHLFQIKFKAHSSNQESHTSVSILKDVITYIQQQRIEHKAYLINRNQNREVEGPRELFMSFTSQMVPQKRFRCSLALIRSGRTPQIKKADSFALVPFDKSQGEITEETHFWIDYSTGKCYVCVEFNANGPRMSDIEFYLRSVSHRKLGIAKSLDVEIIMETSIDKTIANLKNVLKIDIKMDPKKVADLPMEHSNYLSSISSLGRNLNPKWIKVEASFQTKGKSLNSNELNFAGNKMVRAFMELFKSDISSSESFDDFVIRFENKQGMEEIFNLLNGKKEFLKEVDVTTLKKERDWYELIEKDFDDYIKSLKNG